MTIINSEIMQFVYPFIADGYRVDIINKPDGMRFNMSIRVDSYGRDIRTGSIDRLHIELILKGDKCLGNLTIKRKHAIRTLNKTLNGREILVPFSTVGAEQLYGGAKSFLQDSEFKAVTKQLINADVLNIHSVFKKMLMNHTEVHTTCYGTFLEENEGAVRIQSTFGTNYKNYAIRLIIKNGGYSLAVSEYEGNLTPLAHRAKKLYTAQSVEELQTKINTEVQRDLGLNEGLEPRIEYTTDDVVKYLTIAKQLATQLEFVKVELKNYVSVKDSVVKLALYITIPVDPSNEDGGSLHIVVGAKNFNLDISTYVYKPIVESSESILAGSNSKKKLDTIIINNKDEITLENIQNLIVTYAKKLNISLSYKENKTLDSMLGLLYSNVGQDICNNKIELRITDQLGRGGKSYVTQYAIGVPAKESTPFHTLRYEHKMDGNQLMVARKGRDTDGIKMSDFGSKEQYYQEIDILIQKHLKDVTQHIKG